MRFLKNAGAFLAAEVAIALAVAQLKDHYGLVRGHVPAAHRVFLYHSIAYAMPVFSGKSRIICPKIELARMINQAGINKRELISAR